jgi:Domain of unknown function (DUF5916)/Carbohydrate family 9 binding domain-like
MKKTLLFYLLCVAMPLAAQVKNTPGKEFAVKKIQDAIKLDGELTEASWLAAEKATDFFMSKPIDSMAPTHATYFYITFDEQNLYVAFECMDNASAPIVQSLRRDFDFGPNDNVGIYFDPYNDFTNGFYFNITPYGVQREGTMANAGTTSQDFSSFWDNKWYSAVKRYDDRWIAEIAIPFKSIRYNSENWNFNVLRNDAQGNQISSWIATPVQYLPAAFQNSGKMVWQDPLPKPGTNISFVPYVTTRASNASGDSEVEIDAGFDAKIAVTPSLNLDLTVNPDFSNVEVDKQVVNLTRFEVNFPERRQFFLENTDLFATPGFVETRPFFSRRVGLAKDSSGNLNIVPITYGARLSGKLGPKWRIGVLNTQTRETKSLGLPDQNYSVAVVQRQVFARSNFDLVFINKQSLGLGRYDSTKFYHSSVLQETYKPNGDTTFQFNKYNRVIGGDFNLLTKNNRWNGDIYYFRSLDAFDRTDNHSFGAFIGYFSRNLNAYLGHENVGKGYRADAGFVPQLDVYPGYRNGFVRVENPLYPKSKKIVNIRPAYGFNFTMTPDGNVTDRSANADIVVTGYNTSTLSFAYSYINQVLPRNFNALSPIKGNEIFLTDDEFSWNQTTISYTSDTRKLFTFKVGTSYGGFYSGNRFNVNGVISYRFQPFGSISVDADYNDIRLGGSYGSATFFLLSPRFDFTFTDKLFLTTFVQYNEREDNVNLNARFQWRFKPASDFFVVYTENYLPETFGSKSRALVLKLTYWFNL